jgi:hypothetical protein
MSKFKKPDAVEKRLKMFVYGPAGVGKTVAALQFKNSAIIDTEKGCDFYSKLIASSGSVVLQSTNPDEIYDELTELLTTKNPYTTLIIDPITQIYNAIQEKWTRIFEKHAKSAKDAEVQDFGMRYWGKVKGEFKAIQRLLLQIDKNVIVTAHQKDVYGAGFSKTGVTFDSMKGDDYFFDLVFRIENRNGVRMAIRQKERALPGENKFPDEFEWSYANFQKYYGAEILEKESMPVNLATPEQVERIKLLVETLNIGDDEVEKIMRKFDVDTWAELTADNISKGIAHFEGKLKAINPVAVNAATPVATPVEAKKKGK